MKKGAVFIRQRLFFNTASLAAGLFRRGHQPSCDSVPGPRRFGRPEIISQLGPGYGDGKGRASSLFGLEGEVRQ